MVTASAPRQFAGLIAWLLVTFVAAATGAAASIQAGVFYGQLVRPDWAPPAGVFGPIWSALYLMMAIAAWQVWRVGDSHTARSSLVLYLVQLAVNALWSWLFFGWHLGAWAFIDVVLLWWLILATLIGFWRTSAVAALLLLPYLSWVSVALALNYEVWQLNPALLGGSWQ